MDYFSAREKEIFGALNEKTFEKHRNAFRKLAAL